MDWMESRLRNRRKHEEESRRDKEHLQRRKAQVLYSDGDKTPPEPLGRNGIEPNKNGPPLGNTPGRHARSYYTDRNLGRNSRLLQSFLTPGGENTRSRSFPCDSNASSRAANVNRAIELSPPGPGEPRTWRGKQNRDNMSLNERYGSNADVPNKPGLDAYGRPRNADVDGSSRLLQGAELQRAGSRHEEENSGSRAASVSGTIELSPSKPEELRPQRGNRNRDADGDETYGPLQGEEFQITETRHEEEGSGSRATSVSGTIELSPSKPEELRPQRGNRNRDADGDETYGPLQGEEFQITETRHEEEGSGSRATNVSGTIELSPSKLEELRPQRGKWNRDADVDETYGPLTRHEEEGGDSRAVRERISRRLCQFKLEHSPIVSRHFEREIHHPCSLEDIEMAIDGPTKALLKSRAQGAQKKKKLKDRLSTLEKEKEKEKMDGIGISVSVLREEYKKDQEEQQSVWRTKEKDYEFQLLKQKEAAKQFQEQMTTRLEEHQSKLETIKGGYNDQIQQLGNTYKGNVVHLEKLHTTQMATLQRKAKEENRKIWKKCEDTVIQLESSIGEVESKYKGELKQLELKYREHVANLQKQLEEEIAQKERDCSDRVWRLEQNSETTIAELYSKIDAIRERHGQEVMERDGEIARIIDGHGAQMTHMGNDYEAQQRQMRKDHNAIAAKLEKQWEEEKRELLKRIDHLQEALVKGGRFKALSDRDLARHFQDLTTDADAYARFRWDDGRRRDKQYLIQNTIWVILYEKIFCTPFRVLGKEGKSLEQQWIAGFGQDRKSTGVLAHGPVPTKDSEKWRYQKIKECFDATSQLLEEGDANYNVKRDYELSVKEAIDDMLRELGRVTSLSNVDEQNFRNLVRNAAEFWLKVGQQRYRLFLVMSDSGGEPLPSGRIAADNDGTQKLVVTPELRRIGSGQGTGLGNDDELVADCKGVFSVFKFH
ncbi:MAG: hypothetical protein M1839_001996 [Geoglossum umbratile]|nr:MAG: hypothetical protein M1839_001996 [Geoglossum umbratile]